MNDTTNNLIPATPETAKDSAGSLERLVRLLSFHHEWKLDEFTLDHISGLKLWHCNGMLCLYVREPEAVHFTLMEKLRLWRHVKRCMRAADSGRLQRLGRMLDEA